MAALQLPPELLHRILAYLDKFELKVIRRTCKGLDDACIPLLFDTIYIAPNYADIEVTTKVFSRFKGYITTLVYGTYYLEMLSFRKFFGWQKSAPPVTFEYEQPDKIEKLRSLWNIHWHLSNEYHHLMNSGDFMDGLRQLLRGLPILRKVILTANPRLHEDCQCRQAVIDAGTRQQNPIPDTSTILSAIEPHADPDCLCLESRLSQRQREDNPWRTLLDALIEAKVSVKEISVGVSLDVNSRILPDGLDIFAFCMTARKVQQAGQLLAGLIRLVLHLEAIYSPDNTVEAPPDVSAFLSATPNLRSLELRYWDVTQLLEHQWDYDSGVAVQVNVFNAITGDCSLPQLEELTLISVDVKENELLRFLRRSPKLRHIKFDFVFLISSTWEHTIEEMRKIVRLESIDFGAYVDTERRWTEFDPEVEIKWKDFVSDFFLENGPNPFSKASSDKILAWYPDP